MDKPRDISTPLRLFAARMAEKLHKNDHKGTWDELSYEYLLARLRQETGELTEAIEARLPANDIIDEAADVANFAMMIADIARKRKGKTIPRDPAG